MKKQKGKKTLKASPKALLSPRSSQPKNFDPLLATYFSQIQQYAPLSREEEHKVAIKYRETGDVELAQKLVTSNLRFVVKVASQYSRLGGQLIELIQQGNMGLMHAVKEYNPYKGTRLITYAVWWIKGYIQEYLRRQHSIVKIATTPEQKRLFYALQKERDRIDELGYGTVIKQLSGKLNIKEKDVEIMTRRMSQRDVSLDQKLQADESKTLLDLQKGEYEESIEDKLIDEERVHVLRDHLNKLRPELNEKELEILNERLLADKPLTLQEIGDRRGVSRESVRQMEARLLKKIKNILKP